MIENGHVEVLTFRAIYRDNAMRHNHTGPEALGRFQAHNCNPE